MPTLNRRQFLRQSMGAATAMTVLSGASVLGANERIVVGLMGVGGRGTSLLEKFAARQDVDEGQFRLIFVGEMTGPVEDARARRLQIHRAQNPLPGDGFQGRRLLQVDAGPDGAIGIVQDLGAGRSQNQAPVNPHALGRDHDEIGMVDGGALDDFLCRLAVGHQRLYPKVPEALVKEAGDLPHPGFMQIFEGAVVGGLNHVQED